MTLPRVLPNRVIQTNFSSGELSPRLRGRVDSEVYYNGVKKLFNMRVYAQGGATSREGSYYVSEVKDSSKTTRLLPFKFSTTQNYILEFGDLYMRVYRDRGQALETAKTITAITQANPAVVTSNAHGYANGDQVYIEDVVGMTQLNGKRYTVANQTVNTFELSGINSTGYGAYVSGGTAERIYTFTLPYTSAQVPEIKYTQSADTLFPVHGAHEPQKITRTSDTAWSITALEFMDGPYLNLNEILPGTVTTSTLTTGGGTVGSTYGFNFNNLEPTDVGRLIRWRNSGEDWAWGRIVTVINPTSGTFKIVSNPSGNPANATEWRMGAWSETTGYPRTITFFQERLVFGGTSAQPQTVWGSRTNDFNNFSPTEPDGTVVDTNGFTFTIADNQVNAIRWLLASGSRLMIGTSDGEYSLYGGSSATGLVPVTPSNVTISREGDSGSAPNATPKKIGSKVLFIQRSERKTIEIGYDYRIDGFEPNDMTLLSEHLTLEGIVDQEFQANPNPTVWQYLLDGALIGCTYYQQQAIMAWHDHLLGGTDAAVKSLAAIPNPVVRDGDDLWMIVSRTIGGATKQYIEYLTEPFIPELNTHDSAFFVDSGLSYNGYQDTTLTPIAASGSGVTVTAGTSVFTASMVGKRIFFTDEAHIPYARAAIVSQTGTAAVVNFEVALPDTSIIPAGQWAVATNTVTGFYHLEGETISLWVDGASHPNVTVANGGATLDDYYAVIHGGYYSNRDIEQWPAEMASAGTVQGNKQRIIDTSMGVLNSVEFKFGPRFNKLETIPSRSSADPMDVAVPLYTGIIRKPFPGSHSQEPTLCIRQDLPGPLTVLFITREMEVYG